jgi:hypothetical protein
MTAGIVILLLINAELQLRKRHTLTREEWNTIARIKSLGYYE